jgi:hypothetical protein
LLSQPDATKKAGVTRQSSWLVLSVAVTTSTVVGTSAADEPVAGAATTTAWYGLALGSSLAWPGAAGANHLSIPVAGPWLALGDTGCDDDESDCSTVWVVVRAILIGIDGVGQAGGLAAMLESAFLPTMQPRPVSPRQQSKVEIHAVPLRTGPSGLGLGLVGRF